MVVTHRVRYKGERKLVENSDVGVDWHGVSFPFRLSTALSTNLRIQFLFRHRPCVAFVNVYDPGCLSSSYVPAHCCVLF